jgi:hypothetical protein
MTNAIRTTLKNFSVGQIFFTPGAVSACSPEHLENCLRRHTSGDWGSICDEDRAINDDALITGERLLSAYPIDPGKPCAGFGENCLWIITEADRSATTFLLPDEYY